MPTAAAAVSGVIFVAGLVCLRAAGWIQEGPCRAAPRSSSPLTDSRFHLSSSQLVPRQDGRDPLLLGPGDVLPDCGGTELTGTWAILIFLFQNIFISLLYGEGKGASVMFELVTVETANASECRQTAADVLVRSWRGGTDM